MEIGWTMNGTENVIANFFCVRFDDPGDFFGFPAWRYRH
jgi:hypothetical protein